MYTHSFSDCAYILYIYENESLNIDNDKGMLIENSLCNFERIMLKLLNNAIVVRVGNLKEFQGRMIVKDNLEQKWISFYCTE